MDERLLGIVKEKSFMRDCIDEKSLLELTSWISFNQMPDVQWNRVVHMHILIKDGFGGNYRGELREGIYLSRDNTWVLLLGTPQEPEQQIINRCLTHLELLNIMSDCSSGLDLSESKQLRHLRAAAPFHGSLGVILGIEKLMRLEYLSLSRFDYGGFLDLSGMRELKHLTIQGNRYAQSQTIQGFQFLEKLEHLDLWRVFWRDTLDVSRYPYLKLLSMWDGMDEPCEEGRIQGISQLKNLQTLQLRGNQTISITDLSPLRHMRSLYLTQSRGVVSLNGIEHLQNLEYLNISGTGIKRIPNGIRTLKKLKRIDLSDLKLDELPYWLPELGLKLSQTDYTDIELGGTEVTGVDMSIFDQPQDVILKWFEDLKHKSMIPLQEVKVVFLGDGEAGKTHTIARLLNDGNAPKPEDFNDKATPGIVIKDKSYDLDGKTVNVHFWDFGGQEIMHSMHRMFLTERTLYVVLLNARDDTQDDRARYWLHNIRSFAGESPVVLVLNKIDQNPNANVNEPELKELHGGLRRVVNLSALEYTPEQFNAALTDALKEEIRALGTVGTLWPASWAKLKTGLETMESKYITGMQYLQMCEESGVEQNEAALLRWFNDLGVSFCYQGSARLEHYVILRPEWITNGIYILLFNKSGETTNGLIPRHVIYEMLNPKKGNLYRRVLDGMRYDVNEADYVLEVMRKFRLSYAVSDSAEFIPALCQRNSMPIATEYANDPDALEFRLTYDYLPDNVIHRLMVEMRQDLQLSDVWRTGALFRQAGTGLSAVVKSEGDVLRIFVRSDNALHRPNTYLCILKENIDRINRDMKLAAPFAEVVYKTARGKELFDYEDLLNAFEEGREGYRSKKLRRDIPIQDILNQTGRGAELALEKLRDDILTACLQMQQNRSFWTANEESRIEDERNTYLRDTLINLGYLASDQHLQGLGSGSRGYGELDLDIRREPAIPWTILEALRIKGASTIDWNRHLKKLLDNYNPSGMRHLFLLTYVDCSKDDFEEILQKFSEHVKWHDDGVYVRLENTFNHIPLPGFGDPHYLKVMRSTYDRSGAPTTVTHIFVRMGE